MIHFIDKTMPQRVDHCLGSKHDLAYDLLSDNMLSLSQKRIRRFNNARRKMRIGAKAVSETFHPDILEDIASN